MRCERVTRPTWRGVKRAEDSVEGDIFLELRSRVRPGNWSEAGNRGWLDGIRHIELPHFIPPRFQRDMSDAED
jgi:hypothetical protein